MHGILQSLKMPSLPGHPMPTFRSFVHTLPKNRSLFRLWSYGMTLLWYAVPLLRVTSAPNGATTGMDEANRFLCESCSSFCHYHF